MADDAILAAKARDAIRSGVLPARAANRTFGGPGSGATCAVCGEPVTRNQMELEIEFNRHGSSPGLDRYHLHTKCFAAWELERKKSGADSRGRFLRAFAGRSRDGEILRPAAAGGGNIMR